MLGGRGVEFLERFLGRRGRGREREMVGRRRRQSKDKMEEEKMKRWVVWLGLRML